MVRPAIALHGMTGVRKIAAMAEIAREEGFHVESVDYRGIEDRRRAIDSAAVLSRAARDALLAVGLEVGSLAIGEMNKWGIMVDVSHPSKQSNLQAIALSKAPVIASHSGVRALAITAATSTTSRSARSNCCAARCRPTCRWSRPSRASSPSCFPI